MTPSDLQSLINRLSQGRKWIEIVEGTDDESDSIKAEFEAVCVENGLSRSLVDGLLKRNTS